MNKAEATELQEKVLIAFLEDKISIQTTRILICTLHDYMKGYNE